MNDINKEQKAIEDYPIPDSANNCIFFWGPTNDTGKVNQTCFSQWYPSEFQALIKSPTLYTFQNAEQYMMASKAMLFRDYVAFDKIMLTADPKEMKKIGRTIRNFDENKWKEKRFPIVLFANIRKFISNPDLQEYLIGTGDKYLVEASPYDKIWGIGKYPAEAAAIRPNQWNGSNLLGLALMESRKILKEYKLD